MKKYILMTGACLVLASGCAVTQKLPTVTVGGKANNDRLLGVGLSKEKGLSVTAPLVDITVPPLGVKLGEEGKK
jgi:hypothetical protein